MGGLAPPFRPPLAGRDRPSRFAPRDGCGSPTPYSGQFVPDQAAETAEGSALNPLTRIAPLVDDFEPWSGPERGVVGDDPLAFPGYHVLRAQAQEACGADEAVVTGRGVVQTGGGSSLPVAVIGSVFEFIGGSMGAAVGERVVRAYERALHGRLPVLVVAASGGARMQEGMVSLIQMARTADAARRHAEEGLLQVSYLCSPTTGGVYASFASLADVVFAAPGATIGFAGPRVVEQTTGVALPDGAHTSESAHQAGIVDAVLEAHAARARLATLLRVAHLAANPTAAEDRVAGGAPADRDLGDALPSAWEEVVRARDPQRPSGRAWLERLVPERVELVGDRAGGVDPVVTCALGRTPSGMAVLAIALDRHTADGRPRPSGYRTARRALAIGARLGLPLVTLVDTPGADPSHASETTGIAGEIARTFATITGYPNPSVSLVVGEGGSGGALALASTDRLLMLEGSIFSVIAPEGAAAILHRDAGRASEVASQLRLTGPDLLDLGIVDAVVREERAVAAMEQALGTARAGDGRDRFDRATQAWLR